MDGQDIQDEPPEITNLWLSSLGEPCTAENNLTWIDRRHRIGIENFGVRKTVRIRWKFYVV
jgi:hypothetical protein